MRRTRSWVINMFQPNYGTVDPAFNKGYQEGIRDGLAYVDAALQKATKQLHKTTRLNIAKTLASTTTYSSHKCDCEFCRFND